MFAAYGVINDVVVVDDFCALKKVRIVQCCRVTYLLQCWTCT